MKKPGCLQPVFVIFNLMINLLIYLIVYIAGLVWLVVLLIVWLAMGGFKEKKDDSRWSSTKKQLLDEVLGQASNEKMGVCPNVLDEVGEGLIAKKMLINRHVFAVYGKQMPLKDSRTRVDELFYVVNSVGTVQLTIEWWGESIGEVHLNGQKQDVATLDVGTLFQVCTLCNTLRQYGQCREYFDGDIYWLEQVGLKFK